MARLTYFLVYLLLTTLGLLAPLIGYAEAPPAYFSIPLNSDLVQISGLYPHMNSSRNKLVFGFLSRVSLQKNKRVEFRLKVYKADRSPALCEIGNQRVPVEDSWTTEPIERNDTIGELYLGVLKDCLEGERKVQYLAQVTAWVEGKKVGTSRSWPFTMGLVKTSP